MKCQHCGATSGGGLKFCGECGKSLTSESKKKRITWVSGILTAIIILVIILISRAIGGVVGQNLGNTLAPPLTNAEYISKSVEAAQSSTTFPYHVDEVTTMDSITGSDVSIDYNYTLTGVTKSQYDEASFRTHLASGVCSNADTREILDRGIWMNYYYSFHPSDDFMSYGISSADCL